MSLPHNETGLLTTVAFSMALYYEEFTAMTSKHGWK